MPKPNKQQIRDAIDDARGQNPHLGVEYCVHTVMDQYDISGLDVAMAYIDEAEDIEAKEVRTGDDASDTAAVSEMAHTEDDHRVELQQRREHDEAVAKMAAEDAKALQDQANASAEAENKEAFDRWQKSEDEAAERKRLLDPDNASHIDPEIEAKKKDFDEESAAKKAALNKTQQKDEFDWVDPNISSKVASNKVADNTSKGEATKMPVPGEPKDMPNQGFAANNPNRDAPAPVDSKAKADVTQSPQSRNVDKKAVPGETASKSNQGFAKNNPNRK